MTRTSDLRELARRARDCHDEFTRGYVGWEERGLDTFRKSRSDGAFILVWSPDVALRALAVIEAAEAHAKFDESMDPCDGNPCSMRTALTAWNEQP